MDGELDESRISRSHLSIIIITGTHTVRTPRFASQTVAACALSEKTQQDERYQRPADTTRETGGNEASLCN